jgi:CHAT domain-containing protein/tetratricopeptide (TPR) repeat protein
MSRVIRFVLRPLVLGAVVMLVVGGVAPAKQPSKELEDLREQSQAHWRGQDYARAREAAERALRLVLREFGPDHEQTALQYFSLGLIAQTMGDYARAEGYFADTVRVREKVYGTDSVSVAIALEQQGQALLKGGRPEAAERLFRRALEMKQSTVGSDHAFNAGGHASLGDVALARGQWEAARGSYRQAIRLLTGQDKSYDVVRRIVEREVAGFRDTFAGLSQASWHLSSESKADKAAILEETFAAAQLAWQTSAASALAKMTARLGASNTALGQRIRRVQDLADSVLVLHDEDQKLLTDWYAVQKADPVYSRALDEFRAASIARNRDQAPTVKRQTELVRRLTALTEQCPPAQRKAGCDDADRERSVIATELNELSKVATKGTGEVMAIHARMEAAEKALPGYAQFTQRREGLRSALDRAEQDIREARVAITTSFPDYAALADPQPLTIAAVQGVLRDEEALVVFLVGSTKSFVWAVTRERAEWAQIDAGNEVLGAHVTALRGGLDPRAQRDAEGSAGSKAGVVAGFDLNRAHTLYKLVLGPVAPLLRDKRHLILVPTGPLTSIPLQVLITAPPGPQAGTDALRQAPWLIKSHAMSVLPSVQSLQALRKLAPIGAATKPFFGVGDPIFGDPPGGAQQRGAQRLSTAPAQFYRDGVADLRALRELAPLPETAQELIAVGKVLGAAPDAIYLREAASEPRVRSAPLKDYRILHFATHGLVAGDLSGLTEPALVLTLPPVASETDDGLLTASEIATLSLDADWVVLSACNTAAGSGRGAEALSGLARAFFYAGARAVLASHWAVYSQAAVELTTGSFAALAARPRLGRAGAFRSAMLDLIARGEPPSYWAPFVLVGEGVGQDMRQP